MLTLNYLLNTVTLESDMITFSSRQEMKEKRTALGAYFQSNPKFLDLKLQEMEGRKR